MNNNFSNVFGHLESLYKKLYEGVFTDINQSTTETNRQDEIEKYLNSLANTPPVVEVSKLFNFFQSENCSLPHSIEFNTLSNEQKTLISMIYVTEKYITCLIINREILIEVSQITHYTSKNKYTGNNNDLDIFLYFSAFKEEVRLTTLKLLLSGCTLLPNEPHKLAHRYSAPPLRTVFNSLTQIKYSFQFLLEWFWGIIGPLEHITFDYKEYKNLVNAVTEENYERFCIVVNDWNEKVVNQLSSLADLTCPILKYFESHTIEFEQILYSIKKDITTIPKDRVCRVSSPIRLMLFLLIIYIFRNNVDKYLLIEQRINLYSFFLKKSETFVTNYFDWINNEIEAISEYFTKLLENSVTVDPGNNRTNAFSEPQIQLLPKKKIMPNYLKIHIGRKMLEKLVEGLVEGHKDETLGYLTPLVSSKTGEDKETIKKKLICLFTGEGINDESIKLPYNLEWEDKGNSLKLLVYLLHYEGIIIDPLDKEEGAINENDVEGINKKIRTEFRGKNVWAIVGPALGYGENTLRNKNKIPKQSNLSLMKKLAQFWFECKKLDD